MVVSIEPFLKDAWVKSKTDDDKIKVLVNFWNAAKDSWPAAFDSPKDYRVQGHRRDILPPYAAASGSPTLS